MGNGSKGIFLVFLLVAAFYDWKEQKVPLWLFGLAFLGAVGNALFGEHGEILWKQVWQQVLGVGVGISLILVSKMVRGAVGMGDGLFFCISGILLGFDKNVLLLIGGIFLCGIYSVFLILFGVLAKVSVRTWRLPFLTFLLPIGILVVLL